MRLRTSRERFSSASDLDMMVVAKFVNLWLGKKQMQLLSTLVVNYETTAPST